MIDPKFTLHSLMNILQGLAVLHKALVYNNTSSALKYTSRYKLLNPILTWDGKDELAGGAWDKAGGCVDLCCCRLVAPPGRN